MRILFAVTFIFSALYANAQSTGLGSLLQRIKQHPQDDTFKVNRLIELSGQTELAVSARDSAAAAATTMAKKIGYLKGVIAATMQSADVAFLKGGVKAAISVLQQACHLAEKEDDKESQAFILGRIASYKLNFSDTSGVGTLQEAISLAEKLPDKSLLAGLQRNMGDYYSLIAINYPIAMEWVLKSVQTGEQANCESCLESSWLSMANLYSMLGDQETALSYLQRTLQSYQKRGIEPDAGTLNTIGERHRLLGNYPEALKYYQDALALTKDSLNKEIYISNVADVYVRMDSVTPGLHTGFVSLRMAEKLDDIVGVAWINGILARAYLKKNMPDSALYHAGLGMHAAQQIHNLEYMRDNSEALSNAYEQKGNFERAFYYQNMYITYRDSILNEKVSNKTNQLQFDYQREKTQAHIDLLTQQKKNQRNRLVAALVVLGLIVLTAVLLLRNNSQKRKANLMLKKQKEEIDAKAKDLAVQKDHLEKSYNNVELLGDIGRNITSSLSLKEVIRIVYHQVNKLMDASVFGLGIYNRATKMIEFPATYENGEALPAYANAVDDKNRFASVCFSENKEIVMGDLNEEYADYVEHITTLAQGLLPASLIFIPLVSKGNKTGVITVQSFQKNAYTDYHLFMLRNIGIYTAIALENATTYGKLNLTLENLKQTQSKLIQSEKMASLGELTAGIAHEIQNPLNFVNNFSEVNTELVNDLKVTLETGNTTEAVSLANDIIENNQRIIFHGKRADSIVKGMLQHSRSSTGVKEPTDINNLCDEFLRLAYHGLRAKDKTFNANFSTDFDEQVQKIDAVPQDLGRAMLNLITNAFYEVDKKKKSNAPASFNPEVKVSTQRSGDQVIISVSDNGDGIQEDIREKIFQPFFTTKPTGQGTGLGLSMSYDIITKEHGGDLQIDSVPGKGATFKIILPIKNQGKHEDTGR